VKKCYWMVSSARPGLKTNIKTLCCVNTAATQRKILSSATSWCGALLRRCLRLRSAPGTDTRQLSGAGGGGVTESAHATSRLQLLRACCGPAKPEPARAAVYDHPAVTDHTTRRPATTAKARHRRTSPTVRDVVVLPWRRRQRSTRPPCRSGSSYFCCSVFSLHHPRPPTPPQILTVSRFARPYCCAVQ